MIVFVTLQCNLLTNFNKGMMLIYINVTQLLIRVT